MNFEDDTQEDFWQPSGNIEVLEDVDVVQEFEPVRFNKIN